jgi:hypothetical protein
VLEKIYSVIKSSIDICVTNLNGGQILFLDIRWFPNQKSFKYLYAKPVDENQVLLSNPKEKNSTRIMCFGLKFKDRNYQHYQ